MLNQWHSGHEQYSQGYDARQERKHPNVEMHSTGQKPNETECLSGPPLYESNLLLFKLIKLSINKKAICY